MCHKMSGLIRNLNHFRPTKYYITVVTTSCKRQLYCCGKTTLDALTLFRNYEYPPSNIRRSMRHKMPTNLTSEALVDKQGIKQHSKPQLKSLVYINGISQAQAQHFLPPTVFLPNNSEHSLLSLVKNRRFTSRSATK